MQINTIIWDIGGVLERTVDAAPRFELASRLGIDVEELSDLIFGTSTEFRVQLGQISREEHLAYVQTQLRLATRAELDQVLDQFFSGDRLDTNLVDHIRQLKTSCTTAVLSNYSEILREKISTTWKIGDAFDHLIISSEVGHKKPDPEIYHIALQTIGCQPDEAAFIDDFTENIVAARQLGIHGIHFKTPEQTLSEIKILLKGQTYRINPMTIARNQLKKFNHLDRSLKMFILVTIFFGLFYSVQSLFFNFYILSLGFDKEFLGLTNSMGPTAALVFGLPLGMLTDRIGRKTAATYGMIIMVSGYALMLMTTTGILILISLFIAGVGSTLFYVSRTPLLTRLTNRQNRNYVFSLDFALSTLAGVFGTVFAGQLPSWFESLFSIPLETTASYQGVMFASLSLALLALIPIGMIGSGSRSQQQSEKSPNKSNSNSLKDMQNILRNPLIWKLVLPNLFIGFGAALMVPSLTSFC